ncbi:calcineurin-like phosphoesterase C-terminal domain-containing protein [Jiangella alkaliphila]|uniref:Calcineurin-like phosphoesterase n=1 Tax=Jiangella alkaliphila TaxID=419479 RepID=A0A1H2KXT0_9ACTN|nr:calcineurin-like phosphoesterase family protein [Jiangella alkaliphila]SDU73543.1 Calcineurin-like phosphoesterase [Jiangella alkaliphila]
MSSRDRVLAAVAGLAGIAAVAATVATPGAAASGRYQDWDDTAYRGQIEVVRSDDGPADPTVLNGTVFNDRDRDSHHDRNERGLRGVEVSNGRDVVTTDSRGRYQLPVHDNMTVFVTQPAGYQVPVDDSNVAQFHYNHLPAGSPELRYGGIEPTGPIPDAVNFPLVESRLTDDSDLNCIIAGDLQTYNITEVEYARKGAIRDLSRRDDYQGCGSLFVGDVVGDDLSLYDEVKGLTAQTNGPARFLPGNHDLDFDATTAEHSFDTFRAQLAPAYFSYDVGEAHVIALNTVRYPCTPDLDNADGLRPECNDPVNRPRYNGFIDATQMEWLRQDLAQVDRDKLIVIAGHIGLLNWADEGSAIHQVDQVREVYELLHGRKAVALAGHSHSIENLRTGDSMQGWNDLFGVDSLPFPHLTVGAIAGDWFSGRVTEDGYPTALQRDGGRPGVLTLELDDASFQERFTVTGEPDREQTQLGLNTPAYRDWFVARDAWNDNPAGAAPELGDPLVVDQADLAGGTWLTTNFFIGGTGSTVTVRLDRGRPVQAVRTQAMQGEDQLIGPEYSDPVAVAEQLVHGGSVADRTMHLWRFDLPADLAPGTHRAHVTATDVHGRRYADTLTFQVVAQR